MKQLVSHWTDFHEILYLSVFRKSVEEIQVLLKTERVKIVINDNIIEQVTDFKYLGYCISEFKSDVEDKLETYNKINGAIRRHFGKQMNKETKLRIHNITPKAALKFGSEAWVLKKIEEQRLAAAQMEVLRHLLRITKVDKENKRCIREKTGA